jgi:hypothetical protein
MGSPKKDEEYSQKEATARFEAALKGAMNAPHKPLKDKPKVKKPSKRKRNVNAKT